MRFLGLPDQNQPIFMYFPWIFEWRGGVLGCPLLDVESTCTWTPNTYIISSSTSIWTPLSYTTTHKTSDLENFIIRFRPTRLLLVLYESLFQSVNAKLYIQVLVFQGGMGGLAKIKNNAQQGLARMAGLLREVGWGLGFLIKHSPIWVCGLNPTLLKIFKNWKT